MKTVNVAVRLDPEYKTPVLFFWNSNNRGLEWLMCYSRIGQHSKCSIEYMRKCKPIKTPDAEALALVREWDTLGPEDTHTQSRIVQRLTRSREHGC